ncbi:Uncharacterized protein Fot_33175 [Forsythia ovata]|uniref:Uncharacterized protein n=1 Tax=Forsythia ovata TaxID=205694 RepID=A0ABD1TAG5_9LAMI
MIKVVVVDKFSPSIAQKSPTKYQNLILMDSESTKQNLEKCNEQSQEELEYAAGHTNSEMIDDIVCEKNYLSLTPSKLSSKLSVPTYEKDFTKIRSIQGLKTMVRLWVSNIGALWTSQTLKLSFNPGE